MDIIGTDRSDFYWFPFGSEPARIVEAVDGAGEDVLLLEFRAFEAPFFITDGASLRPVENGYAFSYGADPFQPGTDGGTIEIPFTNDPSFRDRGVEWIELRDVDWTGYTARPVAVATLKIVGLSDLTSPSPLPDAGIVFGTGDEADTIRLPAHVSPAESLSAVFANAGDDRLVLSSDGDWYAFGGPGRDTILARGAGRDTLSGEDGRDTLLGAGEGDDLRGGEGGDDLRGGGGADSLAGEAGDDLLRGGEGADRLGGDLLVDRYALPIIPFPPVGDDTLFGGAGDDTLAGGYGDNRLSGGADADLFIVWLGGGVDTLTDFEVGVDFLWVECDCSLVPRAVVRDGDTIIRMGGQREAVLLGVEATLAELQNDLG